MLDYVPVVGLEREYYANCTDAPVVSHPLLFASMEEDGHKQFEYALKHTKDIAALVAADCAIQAQLIAEVGADFSAKPSLNQPSSGLHIHLHLENAAGENVFTKTDEALSEPLAFAIAGLLAAAPDDMPIFCPTEASRLRFQHPDFMTPTTLSWGGNNRTTALRLPDTGFRFRRIEHRISGADVGAMPVITAILKAVEKGLQARTQPPPQVFGDAKKHTPPLPTLLSYLT